MSTCFFFSFFFFFFFNDTATTEIYTLSLHDALPICRTDAGARRRHYDERGDRRRSHQRRSEEHTSELQSQSNLVCRLLLEKKKKKKKTKTYKYHNQAKYKVHGPTQQHAHQSVRVGHI